MGFIVIGMNLTGWTDCRKWMLHLDPFHSPLPKIPFDFHSDFYPLSPHFASSIVKVSLPNFEPNIGKLPQGNSIAPLTIREPPDKPGRFRPFPSL